MKLVKAVTMEKAFINLFNIYAHELSRYNPWLGTQIDLDGNYLSEDVKQYLHDVNVNIKMHFYSDMKL